MDQKKVRESRVYAGSDTERLDYGRSVVCETRMAFQRVASIIFWSPFLDSRLYSTPSSTPSNTIRHRNQDPLPGPQRPAIIAHTAFSYAGLGKALVPVTALS